MREETLGDVGEFGLVARRTARLAAPRRGERRDGAGVLLGPGDDAAVVAAPDGRVVATTDMLVEGRHFRLDWSSPYDVGRKAAAQNLSDVVATGARPTALLVALGAPPSWPVAAAEELADGLRDECAVVGATVVGGDVVGAERLVLGVTALGSLDGRAPVTRSGARVGDLVVLAGAVGRAEAGLLLLLRDELGPVGVHDQLVEAHRRPAPPYAAGLALAVAGATAMVDVSDGLLADAGHVAAASGVAIDFVSAALVDPGVAEAARDMGLDPLDLALAGGDDHAFLATLPPDAEVVAGTVVGSVVAGSGVLVDGAPRSGRAGWDHFGLGS